MNILNYMPEYVRALAERIEERISSFVNEHRVSMLYIDFSGGKDSSVVLAAAARALGPGRVQCFFMHIPGQTLNAGVARAVAEALGFTWVTVRPLRPEQLMVDASRSGGGVCLHVMPKTLDYWSALERYGLPAQGPRVGKRWCCWFYKSRWLDSRPRNCPAGVCYADGVRREESVWRRRKQEVERTPAGLALHAIYDLAAGQVWALLEHYGVRDIVEEQYMAFRRAPNCALCPLAGTSAWEQAARALPKPYLQRALRALEAAAPRLSPGSKSRERGERYIHVLRRVLEEGRVYSEEELAGLYRQGKIAFWAVYWGPC